MAGLNIKLKNTVGISGRSNPDNSVKQITLTPDEQRQKDRQTDPSRKAREDVLMYGGTVRGAGYGQESNNNAILNDRGVQQIASPTQRGRTATQRRPAPSFIADRNQPGRYTGDNSAGNVQRPTRLGVEEQIKANNMGIITPTAPTDTGDVANIAEPNTLDDMYTGTFGVKKPTKGENIAAEIEAKRAEQEAKLLAEQQNLSIIEQTEYAKKAKEQKDYMEEQRALQEEQDRITEEQIGIQEDAQLKQASDSISRLRQNLGFLGGSNSVSQQALDSAGRQITSANTLYANMKHLNELGGRARGVQTESMKKQFNWDLKLLQDDLDTNVDKVLQQAFNGLSAADMAGKLDTVEEVNAMRLKMLNTLDADVAAVTKGEIQRRQQLLDQYTVLLEDEKERIKQSNTVNADMSAMRGYYVDGNGEAFIDATGAMIPVPKEAPYPPEYIEETGKLITFTWGEDGKTIIPKITDVIDMPTQASDKTIKITNADGIEETYQFNVATGKYDIPVGNSQTLPDDGSPVVQAINQAVMNIKNGAQCGKFVNDVLQNAGLERTIDDTYESKARTIQIIGEATSEEDIGVGSIFAYPVDGSTNGHIGIVTGVNGDGTYDIMDYNYNSDESQRYLKGISAGEILQAGGTISKPIISNNNTQQQFSEAQVTQFKAYNGNTIPEEYKTQAQKTKFINSLSERKKQNPNNFSKDEKLEIGKAYDNLSQDPPYKSFETIKANTIAFQGIVEDLKNGSATAQDKQGLISDFAKVLDPTSVVKEAEYALSAKYSQSKVNQYKQEIYNYLMVGGPLSDEAALGLASGLERRFDASAIAHDLAIDNKLRGVSYILDRDIPVEALQTSYSYKRSGGNLGLSSGQSTNISQDELDALLDDNQSTQ